MGKEEVPAVCEVVGLQGLLKATWGTGNNLVVSEASESAGKEQRALACDAAPLFDDLQRQLTASEEAGDDNGGGGGGLLTLTGDGEDGWEQVMSYSRAISGLLAPLQEVIDAYASVDRTAQKAGWDLIQVTYADHSASPMLTEPLLDWLAEHDTVLTPFHLTVRAKLLALKDKLLRIKFPEDDPGYWDTILAAGAVGWLDTAVALLRMHGSYRDDQINDREGENGLVEAVAVLISLMPRLRPPPLPPAGTPYATVPELVRARERWLGQLARLESKAGPYWAACSHVGTTHGLTRVLALFQGSQELLQAHASHWLELLLARLLHLKPHAPLGESIRSTIAKCKQIQKRASSSSQGGNQGSGVEQAGPRYSLEDLIEAALDHDTEIVVSEASRAFDSWTMAHLLELVKARGPQERNLLEKGREGLGGSSILEFYRLQYAQELASHGSTWQLAPVYLATCPKQGFRQLETLLLRRCGNDNDYRIVLKVLGVCEAYGMSSTAKQACQIAGACAWTQGRRAEGLAWLQRAKDGPRLSSIATQLLQELLSDDAMLETVGSLLDGFQEADGDQVSPLGMVKEYVELQRARRAIMAALPQGGGSGSSETLAAAGRQAASSLAALVRAAKSGVLPALVEPILASALEVLEWPGEVLLGAADTRSLQDLLHDHSLSKQVDAVIDRFQRGLPADISAVEHKPPLQHVRLAVAQNLGRAMLVE
eukprot:SM000002S05729  [mRNA]  locus=s2:1836059:1841266:- [translate_table: standard]